MIQMDKLMLCARGLNKRLEHEFIKEN